jgi:hypothetical protein
MAVDGEIDRACRYAHRIQEGRRFGGRFMGQNRKVGNRESSTRTPKGWRWAAFVGALSSVLAFVTPFVRAHVPTTDVTWARDIAPIVEQRCLGCHSAGGPSSLPLGSYEAARTAAARIKHEVLERRMPPWPAASGFGTFANDRSLSLVETELLVAWADGGTPKGEEVAGAPGIRPDSTESQDDVLGAAAIPPRNSFC